MPSIHIKALQFAYQNHSIYQSFNAAIDKAGIYGLFGRNGSGKSTLLKLLSGLLTPQSGSIEVLGYHPRKRLPDFLQQIYILPEEFHLPDLSPIVLAKTQRHFYPNFCPHLFHDYIQQFEVPATTKFSNMSLGQKKKAAISFALATLTPILLMDEPTNGLDIVSREQFKKLMQTPEQSRRITLISTHQAHDLERIINHVWFIDDGQLLLTAPIEQLNQTLVMGICEDINNLPDQVLYRENLGSQIAWLAAQTTTTGQQPRQLNIEMLYKALSLNKDAIIAAVQQSTQAETTGVKATGVTTTGVKT